MLGRSIPFLICLFSLTWFSAGAKEKWKFPDSPTGRTLTAFLNAVESGEDRIFHDFIENYLDDSFFNEASMEEHVSQFRQIHEALGMVEVLEFDKPDPFAVELVVLATKTGESFRIRMRLNPEPPHRIVGLGVLPVEEAMVPVEVNPQYADFVDPNEVIDPELGRKLDGFIRDYVDKGFSGVVLAVKNGQVILHKGYGFANRERGIPNTTETVFDVASYAKSFTMAAILKLEETGKLLTSDPITKFLDDVPEDKKAITIHHLLTMQSGLHEYHDKSGDFEKMDRVEAVQRILNQELRFKPGENKGYSNSGYGLLAVFIEIVTGQTYQEYLKEHLFEPAGLRHTGFYRDPRWKEDQVAHGYGDRKFGDENSPLHWPQITWACIGGGCLCSSPGDLGRWLDALNTYRILSRKTVEKLYSVYMKPMDTDWAGPTLATMEANDFGFTGASYQFPESNSYLLVTSNAGRRMAPRVAKPLARLMFGVEPE